MDKNIKNKTFEEFTEHLLNDSTPSKYFNGIYDDEIFQKPPFNLLYKLKETDQSPKHHAEGNVWNHTMLVIDEAAKVKDKSTNKKVFMWAALLHDIGKPSATKKIKGRITSYDHDKIGAKICEEFLKEITEDIDFINEVKALVRWHMQILFVVKDLPFKDVKAMTNEAKVEEIALLGLCDRLGRGNVNKKEEENNISTFLEKVKVSK